MAVRRASAVLGWRLGNTEGGGEEAAPALAAGVCSNPNPSEAVSEERLGHMT